MPPVSRYGNPEGPNQRPRDVPDAPVKPGCLFTLASRAGPVAQPSQRHQVARGTVQIKNCSTRVPNIGHARSVPGLLYELFPQQSRRRLRKRQQFRWTLNAVPPGTNILSANVAAAFPKLKIAPKCSGVANVAEGPGGSSGSVSQTATVAAEYSGAGRACAPCEPCGP